MTAGNCWEPEELHQGDLVHHVSGVAGETEGQAQLGFLTRASVLVPSVYFGASLHFMLL